MQTILGANGIIAKELVKHLPQFDKLVRLVSRSTSTSTKGFETVTANLLNAEETLNAIQGSTIAYLVAGIKYTTKDWQEQWPVIMQNVIDACLKNNTRLVFFDNVYAYGKVDGAMTEQTPYNPCSKKGVVRQQIAEMLMDAVEKKQLQAMIVRAADFYGPENTNSMFNMLVTDKHAAGKKAQWLANADVPHSFTYTPDAGKATALLANDASAYQQVWHLPCAKEVLTVRELTAMSADYFEAKNGVQILPKWGISLLGLFNKPIAETIEMLYQFDSAYVFDSSRFESIYGLKATSYNKGLQTIYQQSLTLAEPGT